MVRPFGSASSSGLQLRTTIGSNAALEPLSRTSRKPSWQERKSPWRLWPTSSGAISRTPCCMIQLVPLVTLCLNGKAISQHSSCKSFWPATAKDTSTKSWMRKWKWWIPVWNPWTSASCNSWLVSGLWSAVLLTRTLQRPRKRESRQSSTCSMQSWHGKWACLKNIPANSKLSMPGSMKTRSHPISCWSKSCALPQSISATSGFQFGHVPRLEFCHRSMMSWWTLLKAKVWMPKILCSCMLSRLTSWVCTGLRACSPQLKWLPMQ